MELLTDREVAERLKVDSVATVRRLRQSGALPFVKLPGSRLVRVRAEDVDALIDRARQPQPA
jgi:excisionase family DNA binding protein